MKKISLFFTAVFLCFSSASADMMDYCGSGNNISIPPFLSSSVSPLVMFVMGRDHKLYYEAYNDATDLDGDGVIDIGYKHEIDYYGYFDSHKCYTYSASGTARFNPSRVTNDKYCGGSGEWSGNFMNWLTMSRIDVLRKVLYEGRHEALTEQAKLFSPALIYPAMRTPGEKSTGGQIPETSLRMMPRQTSPAICLMQPLRGTLTARYCL
ncbi:MAG: hypothetical protein LRY50_14700 [Geovibrio sp.]|nr:hypothetical protein [Geovibrio sp.]